MTRCSCLAHRTTTRPRPADSCATQMCALSLPRCSNLGSEFSRSLTRPSAHRRLQAADCASADARRNSSWQLVVPASIRLQSSLLRVSQYDEAQEQSLLSVLVAEKSDLAPLCSSYVGVQFPGFGSAWTKLRPCLTERASTTDIIVVPSDVTIGKCASRCGARWLGSQTARTSPSPPSSSPLLGLCSRGKQAHAIHALNWSLPLLFGSLPAAPATPLRARPTAGSSRLAWTPLACRPSS